MANPQPDKFTRISNELIEHLWLVNLSSYETRILWYIFRKTYGFHKKQDVIPLSQFVEDCKLKRSYVCRTLNSLEKKNIIHRQKGITKIQKDWEKWLVPQQGLPSSPSTGTLSSPSTGTLKRKYKDKRNMGKASPDLKKILPYKKVIHKRGGGFKRIGNILTAKSEPNHQAQQKCFYHSERLGIDWDSMTPDLKGRWMKFYKDAFKNHNQGMLEQAYSYWYDSDKFKSVPTKDKIKLFMWKFYNPKF